MCVCVCVCVSPTLFLRLPACNYLLLFHMKLWFPWCICISKLQFSTFLWMCFRKPLSLLGAKHKKAAATRPVKKRWDGLLLCLVHAGFSKKCKEESALRRHYPCFRSLASKTPYTLYDYVTLIWTKFTRCCWKHLDSLIYIWLPAIVDDPNLVSSQSVGLWDQPHNQKTRFFELNILTFVATCTLIKLYHNEHSNPSLHQMQHRHGNGPDSIEMWISWLWRNCYLTCRTLFSLLFHSPSAIETSIMPSSYIFLYLTINSKRKPLLFVTNKRVVVMMQNTAKKNKKHLLTFFMI